MPSNGEGRAPLKRPGPAPAATTTMLSDQGDPRRVGELLASWLAIRMETVDSLVAEAESKVAVLPDRRHLMWLIGELTVRLHCLELEVAELRKGARR